MKKLMICIAVVGLVGLTACTSDSPTPSPAPTVVPDEWSVATLTVSDPAPVVGAYVQIEALIFNNGTQAADGTTVQFTASGGTFENGSTSTTADTQSGRARVLYTASVPGNFTVRAEVEGVAKSISIPFNSNGSNGLEIYQPLVPNIGAFDGDETVILRGKGIMGPVDVTFNVQGQDYAAIVTNVSESDPLSAPGEITISTPYISAADRNQNQVANVTVVGGVGTASQQTVNLPSAFTFLAETGGVGDPLIYVLDPNYGGSAGGDQITVFGHDLNNATRFEFIFQGRTLTAEILSVSDDGQQMLVTTPRFSATPLTGNELADAKVFTPIGEYTLPQAFIVLADDPDPVMNSLSPIAGPLDGGTLVTIMGSGFKIPVQVRFGNLTATDVNLIDDQTPADNDIITCVAPDYSQQNEVPPVTVDVQVTNMASGKISNTLQYTYGDNLFISGNSPTEGMPGDVVLIYGSGFEDPLQVVFTGGGTLEFEVQSVSGTEIAARIPLDVPPECNDRTGNFRVRLIESNQIIEGGNFTLLGNTPTVVSVDPVFVRSFNNGDDVDPDDITIFGSDFGENVLVKINDYVMSPSSVDVVNDSTIEVEGIPAPNEFGLQYDTSPCTTNDGDPGLRRTPSPVRVTVQNQPGNCSSTLDGALIYEPEDTTCVPYAIWGIQPGDLDFGQVIVGDPPTMLSFSIFNDGGADLMWTAEVSGTDPVNFWIDGGPSGMVPANSNVIRDVVFNPTAEQVFSAVITIFATDPDADPASVSFNVQGEGIPAP